MAMDVARTALRLGAPEVRVTCLEPGNQMPAHCWEIEDARSEGVALFPGRGPVEVLTENGAITGLKVQKVRSVFDGTGRFNPTYEPDSFENISGDMVILAIGQGPDNSYLEESGLETDARGCLAVNRDSLATGVAGVFACGELAAGPGPAIAAVASGHRVAAMVERYLKGEKAGPGLDKTEAIGPLPAAVAERVPRRGRQEMPVLPPGERKENFLPYELGLDERAAICEAGRCLSCGLGAKVAVEKCAACLTCLRVCPYGVPVVEGRAVMPVEGCQACGICAAACPAGAITIGVLDEEAVQGSLGASLQGNIAVFACRGTCIDSLGLGGLKNAPGLEKAGLVELPTANALRLEWLLDAFDNGAAGVAVVACGAEQCRYAGGPAPLEGVVARAGGLLESIGIPAERLYYCRPGEGEDPVSLLAGFAGKLAAE